MSFIKQLYGLDKRKKFTFAAIICGFIGAGFGMFAAWRIEQMFTVDSFSLGFGKQYNSWFWNHSLILSFAFGALAFLLEFIAACLEKHCHTKSAQ